VKKAVWRHIHRQQLQAICAIIRKHLQVPKVDIDDIEHITQEERKMTVSLRINGTMRRVVLDNELRIII